MSLGFAEILPNFSLICLNHTPAVNLMQRDGLSVFCADVELEFPVSNTRSLLRSPKCQQFIREIVGKSDFDFLFFRLNFDPAEIISDLGVTGECRVLNVAASVSLNFESKLNLTNYMPSLLGEFSILRVEFLDHLKLLKEFGDKYVIQASLGWAGNNTWFIESGEQLDKLKLTLAPSQLVKITPYNDGATYTLNACLFNDGVWISQPFIQLTGLPELSPNAGSTVGNVFRKLPNSELEADLVELTNQVAQKLRSVNYLGIFGIDAMIVSQKPILIEINARLTASTSMMSQMQKINGQESLISMHCNALMGNPYPLTSNEYLKGAQLVKRYSSGVEYNTYSSCGSLDISNQQDTNPTYLLRDLQESEVLVLPSPNTEKIGEEVLRVQALNDELLVDNDYQLTNQAKMIMKGNN